MAVPALNPRPGVDTIHYDTVPGRSVRTYRDGRPPVTSYWNWNYISGYSVRSAITRTQPVQLAPGVTWRPPTTYLRKVVRVKLLPGEIDAYGVHEVDTYTHYIVGTEALLYNIPGMWGTAMSVPFYDSNFHNRTNVEVLKKVGDQKVNYLVALAEARKTYDMLSGNFRQLVTALGHVSKREYRAAAKALGINPRLMRNGRSLASRHLEFQYGWLPLMSDIHGTSELLKQKLNQPLILKATRHINMTDAINSPKQVSGWRPGEDVFEKAQGKVRRDYSTTVWGRIDSPHLRFAQQMGVTNPLTVGWELIPYSFIVDWVLPVGSMLDALSATNGVTFVGGYAAFHGQMKVTLTGKVPFSSGGSPGGVTYECFFYNRVALSGWPSVLPYVKPPFSAMHAANSLALLRGRFR